MLWLWIILGIYCYIVIFQFILYMKGIHDGLGFALFPNEKRAFFKLTWFGAIALFILDLIFNPLLYLYLGIGFLFKGHFPKH